MRNLAVRLFVLFVLVAASVAVAPPAQALPRDFVYIAYYDCDWQIVAESYRDCSGQWAHYGSQSGARYRETYTEPCSGFGDPQYWVEQWNGSSWEAYTGGESGVCYCERTQAC
jgi:hypothetical protein